MSEIALRTYIEQLDNLVDRKQLDEAIAHCRHILTVYPKHLDAYRMLGKALLEKGRHGDASDVFQRVLSAAPDDFIAHVGMSIVREDEANLDAALWHMERAFEANPANGGVQQELCRLYGRRDGVVPPRARMTRGALARMYALGGLYLQAEAELRAALKSEPERVDLETVLAQVYWETDQHAQAGDTCSAILKKLPYSKEANRILSDLLRAQGRLEDADAFRQRLIALDPYESKADPMADGRGAASVEPTKVLIPRLDYVIGMEESGAPDWIASIGAKFEEPADVGAASPGTSSDWLDALREAPGEMPSTQELPRTAELPDWLKDLQPSETVTPTPAVPESAVEPAASEPPDWLSALGIAAAAGAGTAAPAPEPMPDWLKTATGPLSPEALPDWMTDTTAAAPTVSAPQVGAVPGEAEGPSSPLAAAPAEDLSEWMQAAAPAAQAPADDLPEWMLTKPIAPTSDEDIPDWMKAAAPDIPTAEAEAPALSLWGADQHEAAGPVASEVEGPLAQAPTPSPEATLAPVEDIPDWLKGAAPPTPEAAGAVPDWMQAAVPTPDEDLPEWLKTATGALPQDALPDWMTRTTPVPAPLPAESEAASAEEVSDWMKAVEPGLGGRESGEIAPAAPPPIEELAPAEDIPDWMRAAAAASTEEFPEWMKPAAPTPAAGVPGEAVSDLEFPEWMKPAAPAQTVSEAEGPMTAAPTEDRPDWMEAAAETTPVQELPEWTMSPPSAAVPAPEAAKPDWLRQMESEADAYEAMAQGQPAQPQAPTPESVKPPVELPDFLQFASPEAIERSSQTGVFDEEASIEEEEVAIAEPGEIPEWLKAMAPPSPEPLSPIPSSPTRPLADVKAGPDMSGMGAEEARSWLEGLTSEPAGPPEDMVKDVQEQAAETPEWVRMPSETEVERPSAELPPWAQAQEPGASDTIVTWLAGKELPEWLRKPGEEAAPPPVDWLRAPVEDESMEKVEGWPASASVEAAAAAEAPAAPAIGEPDFAAMSADEAMRWLEGLAANQGARPEELITLPEERLTEPPAWVTSQLPVTPATIDTPAEIPEPTEGVLPMEPLAAVAMETSTTPEAPIAAEPDLAAMSADEAMRWLEGLAARQGARPEELITQPEERMAEPPAWVTSQPPFTLAPLEAPGDLPEAAEAAPSMEPLAAAPEETPIAADLGAMPDWLRPAEAGVPTESYASAFVDAPTPAAADEHDVAAISADEALRWLEGLAIQQGAKPEELITQPEERMTKPPAWITAEPPVEAAMAAEPAETPVPPTESQADLAAVSTDETPSWLESLAAQQGARPEELITPPEARITEPPAWVAPAPSAVPEPEPPPPVSTPARVSPPAELTDRAPAEAPLGEELPAWLAASVEVAPDILTTPPAAEAPTPKPDIGELPAETPPPADVSRLSRLTERLAATRRAKEAEIEARFAAQRAEQEAARLAVEKRMEERRSKTGTGPLARVGTGSLPQPGTGALARAETGPLAEEPATPPSSLPEVPVARPLPEPLKPTVPEPEPATVMEAPAAAAPEFKPRLPPQATPKAKAMARPRKGRLARSPYAAELPENVLMMGRQFISEQNYEGASSALGYLVESGQMTEDVIQELEGFSGPRPASAPLLRVLGDAYMRHNRLQKALDAYRQALGQM